MRQHAAALTHRGHRLDAGAGPLRAEHRGEVGPKPADAEIGDVARHVDHHEVVIPACQIRAVEIAARRQAAAIQLGMPELEQPKQPLIVNHRWIFDVDERHGSTAG
jgi:hypothetical protein